MDSDVLVVGGGTAGVAAAVSAARAGASVTLVERQGFFGGTMTGVSLGSLCGYYAADHDGNPQLIVGGLPLEIAERLWAVGGAATEPERILRAFGIAYDQFSLKRVLDEILTSAGVRLLNQALVTSPIMEGNTVIGVNAYSPEGAHELRAKAVIDASGNATVAAAAGVEAPIRSEPQNPTAMFRFGGVDVARAKAIERPELHRLLTQAVADGFELPRTAGGMFSVRDGVVHVNVSRVEVGGYESLLDPQSLAEIEVEGRRQVSLYESAFRRYVPGFEHAFVLDSGTEIGLRESRRIRGQYELTADDVRSSRHFDDGIVASAWPVESHGAGTGVQWEWPEPGRSYQIPLRTLIPAGDTDGLVVAGRTLSADPIAHASARVAAQCMGMGEATGILAARSAAEGVSMRSFPTARVTAELIDRGARLEAQASR